MNKPDVDVNVNGQAVDVKSADNKASEKRLQTYAERFKKWQSAETQAKK